MIIKSKKKSSKRSKENQLLQKLKPIKLFLMDVDGILTNGLVYYGGSELGFNRFFHVADGYIIKVLMEAGIQVGVISGGDSIGLRERLNLLHVNFLFLGDEDKRKAYIEVKKLTGLEDHQILYMGDEFFDLPLLKRAGFSATVPHASEEIKRSVDYITKREGGYGAVREVADLLRKAQGWQPTVLDFESCE